MESQSFILNNKEKSKEFIDLEKSPLNYEDVPLDVRTIFENWKLKGEVQYGSRILYMNPFRILYKKIPSILIPLQYANFNKQTNNVDHIPGIGYIIVEEKSQKTLFHTTTTTIREKIKSFDKRK